MSNGAVCPSCHSTIQPGDPLTGFSRSCPVCGQSLSVPGLPVTLFTSTEGWNPKRIGALALYCSDGRWGEAFDEFCYKCLRLPRYDRLAVPGGPGWIIPREAGLNDLSRVIREQIGLLVRVHELEQIHLITHHGCAFYRELLQRDPDECLPVQMEEARTAARTLHAWFPGLQVEAYLAMRTDQRLSFHHLDGSQV